MLLLYNFTIILGYTKLQFGNVLGEDVDDQDLDAKSAVQVQLCQ